MKGLIYYDCLTPEGGVSLTLTLSGYSKVTVSNAIEVGQPLQPASWISIAIGCVFFNRLPLN